MFGRDYIVQIGEETYKAATQGLYALVCQNLLETESDRRQSNLPSDDKQNSRRNDNDN